MSHATATHASAELLSAYLDRELDRERAREVQDHLDDCDLCRDRYAGLQDVVTHLRRLDAPPIPPTLDQAVARRIALDGERKGLLDRFEDTLGKIPRQSSTFALFSVVMALAVILYLFSLAVDRSSRSHTRVIFTDIPGISAQESLDAGSRTFIFSDDLWIEEGVDSDAIERELAWSSEEGDALLAADPELGSLRELGRGVILDLDGEVVLVHVAAAPAAAVPTDAP